MSDKQVWEGILTGIPKTLGLFWSDMVKDIHVLIEKEKRDGEEMVLKFLEKEKKKDGFGVRFLDTRKNDFGELAFSGSRFIPNFLFFSF